MSALEVVGSALMVAGAALCVVAGVGLHRFADVFARMHVATKPATLGAALVLGGATLALGQAGPAAKLVLVLAFLLATAPTAAHMVGRAAYRSGNELSPTTVLDELGPDRPDHPRRPPPP